MCLRWTPWKGLDKLFAAGARSWSLIEVGCLHFVYSINGSDPYMVSNIKMGFFRLPALIKSMMALIWWVWAGIYKNNHQQVIIANPAQSLASHWCILLMIPISLFSRQLRLHEQCRTAHCTYPLYFSLNKLSKQMSNTSLAFTSQKEYNVIASSMIWIQAKDRPLDTQAMTIRTSKALEVRFQAVKVDLWGTPFNSGHPKQMVFIFKRQAQMSCSTRCTMRGVSRFILNLSSCYASLHASYRNVVGRKGRARVEGPYRTEGPIPNRGSKGASTPHHSVTARNLMRIDGHSKHLFQTYVFDLFVFLCCVNTWTPLKSSRGGKGKSLIMPRAHISLGMHRAQKPRQSRAKASTIPSKASSWPRVDSTWFKHQSLGTSEHEVELP